MSTPSKPFSVRDALVLLISIITGVAAGFLFHAGTHSVPLAILTGGAAFAAAWKFFDSLIR
jgi:hypothetical protein